MKTIEFGTINLQEKRLEGESVKDKKSSGKKLLPGAREAYELANEMLHDVRSPLNALIGICEYLRDNAAAKTSQEMAYSLNKVCNSIYNLSTIIDNFVTAAQQKIDHGDFITTEIDLISAIENIIDQVKDLMVPEKKNVNILFNHDNINEALIDANPVRLKQLLTNLIDNAIRYTEKGNIKITLKESEERGSWEISISDEGPGLSEDELENVFYKFVRGTNNTQEDRIPGHGVGLHLCKAVANELRGKIWVVNNYTMPNSTKTGATFTVLLPMIKTKS